MHYIRPSDVALASIRQDPKVKKMSEALQLLHRAVRQLNLPSVLQRALRTLGLLLAQMSRRRGQELHTETEAGGAPSVMVSITHTRCSPCSES